MVGYHDWQIAFFSLFQTETSNLFNYTKMDATYMRTVFWSTILLSKYSMIELDCTIYNINIQYKYIYAY